MNASISTIGNDSYLCKNVFVGSVANVSFNVNDFMLTQTHKFVIHSRFITAMLHMLNTLSCYRAEFLVSETYILPLSQTIYDCEKKIPST